MHKWIFLLAVIFAGALVSLNGQNNSNFVNVFIGTDGTGHTFPGPSMPFGMVQPGPDNQAEDWNHTCGYQYRDTLLAGFSQTRLSGTGISELGDILLLPYVQTQPENLRFQYFKDSEKANPGYYTLTKKDRVKVELTCTERVAFHRYTYPLEDVLLLVDLQHGLRFLTDSLVLDSDVKIEDSQTISGYCHNKNWVERRYFFVLKTSKPFTKPELLPRAGKENAPKYILTFKLDKTKVLLVKVSLSTVDVGGAKLNLQTEMPGWDFDLAHENAAKAWNRYLGRIDIEADNHTKEIFYTSLYHFLLQPSNIADLDGRYRGADDKIEVAPNKEYYSTLSIWDIYRGAFPLLGIIVPEKINGIVNSLLLHHKAAGFLPIWAAWGKDNYCMIGNHAIPMILFAYNNGFRGFDPAEALTAMEETSTKNHINSDWELYNKYGYYPFDKLSNESVSRTLESGYDDWCVASMAKELGDKVMTDKFFRRASYYKNLYDPASRLFRGRDTQGNFRSPFDPLAATSPMNNPGDYTEANAWQYFWTPAQYDVEGIISLLGGKEAFTKQLDDFFTIEAKNPDKFLGQEAMIGQYAHGNEPDHHVIYLYAYSTRPETGQKYIHRIITQFHKNTPDGMIGNDDCGQMSAWYILSSLGFFPVNPASSEFVLGAPQIRKSTIHLANGRNFIVEAKALSTQNIFVEKTMLNGKTLQAAFIKYEQIIKGGNLIFEMTDK
ncbi:MAG: GH92 family glycosyl hydrolase [Bacteroidetes bacterium]|nr:GH92 family glycosyl hydrolase [Bacteroidota bacterium]